jgi:hypothetical protein
MAMPQPLVTPANQALPHLLPKILPKMLPVLPEILTHLAQLQKVPKVLLQAQEKPQLRELPPKLPKLLPKMRKMLPPQRKLPPSRRQMPLIPQLRTRMTLRIAPRSSPRLLAPMLLLLQRVPQMLRKLPPLQRRNRLPRILRQLEPSPKMGEVLRSSPRKLLLPLSLWLQRVPPVLRKLPPVLRKLPPVLRKLPPMLQLEPIQMGEALRFKTQSEDGLL